MKLFCGKINLKDFITLEIESIRAINTLKKSSTPKIQKIQLMKQYFKDYKSKMAKEEEIVNEVPVNFESQNPEVSKGVFYKKKIEKDQAAVSDAFLFNFNENTNDNAQHVIEKLEKL